MNFDDLTPEQKEKALACKTSEEILALIKEEGLELNEQELEAVSGGTCWSKCPGVDKCGHHTCGTVGWS